jgi:hypothetical protein
MNEEARNAVIQRLLKAGWITGIRVTDLGLNATQTDVVWTRIGRRKMLAFHSLFDELGYHSGMLLGELAFLTEVSRICYLTRDKDHGRG